METIGVLFAICVLGLGFWLLILLALFVGYWVKLTIIEKFNPELANKIANWGNRD